MPPWWVYKNHGEPGYLRLDLFPIDIKPTALAISFNVLVTLNHPVRVAVMGWVVAVTRLRSVCSHRLLSLRRVSPHRPVGW